MVDIGKQENFRNLSLLIYKGKDGNMGKRYLSKLFLILRTSYERAETLLGHVLSGVLIVLCVVCIAAEVITRILFSYSFLGLIELVALSMAVITFASLAVIQRSNDHILIDLLETKLSGSRLGVLIKCSNLLLCGAAASILCYVTAEYTIKLYVQHRTTEVLYTPYWPFAVLIPIGLLFFAIRVGIQFTGYIKELMAK